MNYRHYNSPYSAKEKQKALQLWKNSTIEYVCHRYHCSERSLWRWKAQFDGTQDSLINKYSRPHTPHPNSHTDDEIKHIKDLIKRSPNMGLNELYGKLRLNYAYSRNPASLYRFLKKNNYYADVKKPKVRYTPKPYDTPQHLGTKWQLDVKFVPKICYAPCVESYKNFYQYTVLDEASRERFIFAYQELTARNTVDFIIRAITYFRYKPQIIQTDNGSEFTFTRQTKGDKLHALDLLCAQLGINHVRIKPRTPRHNGKVERSHRADNERFYSLLKFYSFTDLQKQMKSYLQRSNNIPMSVLYPVGGKKSDWQSPKQKRAELLWLHHRIVE